MRVVNYVLCLGAALLPAITGAWPGRSAQAVAEFRKVNPCPATGRTRGACHGWEVEHTIPLCAGGSDHPSNMTWMAKAPHREKTRRDLKVCRELRALPKRDG